MDQNNELEKFRAKVSKLEEKVLKKTNIIKEIKEAVAEANNRKDQSEMMYMEHSQCLRLAESEMTELEVNHNAELQKLEQESQDSRESRGRVYREKNNAIGELEQEIRNLKSLVNEKTKELGSMRSTNSTLLSKKEGAWVGLRFVFASASFWTLWGKTLTPFELSFVVASTTLWGMSRYRMVSIEGYRLGFLVA